MLPLGRTVQETRGWGAGQGALDTIRTAEACWAPGCPGLCFLPQMGRGCLAPQILTVERLGLQASASGLGPGFVDSRCVSGGGAGNMKAAPPGSLKLSCWPGPGPGPGAGSSQPLAVCGPRLPWPRLGGSWLGGALWGEGLRVPLALSAPRSPQAGGVCAFPPAIPWGSRAAVWSPRVLWGSWAAVSSLGTALLWRLQSPCHPFVCFLGSRPSC